MRLKLFGRSSLLACTGIVLIATAAVAGSGIGGVFHLGQVNAVNARTQLQGSTTAQQLYVLNNSTSTSSTGVFGQSNKGTAVWGQTSSRIGVRAAAIAKTGANYGLYATTASDEGLAGFFRNTGSPPDLTYGTALRALGAGATGNEINRRAHAAAAGEFIGYVGVTGASSWANGGAGVLALSGVGDYGIYATSSSPDGAAGYFQNRADTAIRAFGKDATGDELGFVAAGGVFVGENGVVGEAEGATGVGVWAIEGNGYLALKANGRSQFDKKVFMFDDLQVNGTLTKGSSTFKIDHPLDPENKYLSHSVVESPDMMNIYNGNIVTDAEGTAVVELPDYFEALNRDPRYQLTVIGTMAQAIVDKKISGNRFSITTSEPNVEVSWQVTGIRQDAFAKQHPVVVQEEKAAADRRRYLHPKAFGKPASLAIGSGIGQVALN